MAFDLEELRAREWLTLDEAAALFGFSRRTLEDWHAKGWLTTGNGWHKIGGEVRISQPEFRERFIDCDRRETETARASRQRKGARVVAIAGRLG